jgi:hypothetical protein
VHELVVRSPALAAQQLVEAAVAEPAAFTGERAEALAQPFVMANPL